jgi:predicted amidohydrolase YtcJ
MLIRNAEINLQEVRDVRIDGGVVAEIGTGLKPTAHQTIVDADGCALLPGLHDHHIHLVSLAASLASIQCGPPEVTTADELAALLHKKDRDPRRSAGSWLRGIGYHESVAGDIDRNWLDRHVSSRPVRVQHRSGRLWILNSRALELLNIERQDGSADDPLERIDGRLTGRLYDADDWLRQQLRGERPNLRESSTLLASFGVTGLTDTTPQNAPDDFDYFDWAQEQGDLIQDVLMMGDRALDSCVDRAHLKRGARKFHLHDTDLPPFDELCEEIRHSHRVGRNVAFHCVTATDLVFAASAIAETGARPGDRIEHASVTSPEILDLVRALGLVVVTQPNFVEERGDQYLDDVPHTEQPWLYRLHSFIKAGIPLAGSTDAPFGRPDPWKAMQAAVSRRTRTDQLLGEHEALSPEAALALFTCPADRPGAGMRRIDVSTPADLCLLNQSWANVRRELATGPVRMTLKSGTIVWMSE